MAVSSPIAKIINPYEVELVEWPLKHVLEGNPVASFCVIGRSDDSHAYTGVWECTPGRFRVEYLWDETIYVIEGRVTLEYEDGTVREFKAGDVVHFQNGLNCIWTVHETVRKTYTLFYPEPVEL